MAIITGTDGDDKYPDGVELHGTNLADQIYGLAGDDKLVGFDGDDLLDGGEGADDLFGSSGFDLASYRGSSAGVQINLYNPYAAGGDATGDELFSIEGVRGSAFADGLVGDDLRNVLRGEGGADVLVGLRGNDTLDGGGGDDIIDGGDGDDRLNGGNGNDTLFGGTGNDELRGGAGIDTAYFVGNGVLVDLAGGTATGGEDGGLIGNDRLTSVENVVGTAGGDLIQGNGGANALRGSSGADVIAGGGGADRFVQVETTDSAPKVSDRFLDFSRPQGDRIDLAAVDANEQANGNQAFRFIGTAQFTAPGQLRHFQQNGDTVIEANTTDLTAGAEMMIVLDPLVSMQAGDFLL